MKYVAFKNMGAGLWSAAVMAAALLPLAGAQAQQVLAVDSYTLSVNGPNNGYGYNDPGGQLTDGLIPAGVGAGYNNWAPYVLWDGRSPTITFDLGSDQAVGQIRAHFLTYPRAAVYLPLSATVRYALDGGEFSQAVTVPTGYVSGGTLAHDTPVMLTFNTPGVGRQVQLTLETPGRWFALSEVQLIAPTAPVPEAQTAWLALAGVGVCAWALRRRRLA